MKKAAVTFLALVLSAPLARPQPAVDDWLRRAAAAMSEVAADPRLAGLSLSAVFARPYLVFVEGDDARAAARAAERLGLLAARVTREVPGDCPDLRAHLFKVLLFTSEEAYRRYLPDAGGAAAPNVRAFFDRRSGYVVRFLEGDPVRDEWQTLHAGVHQIFDALRKAALEKASGMEVVPDDPRLAGRLLWFTEGVCELFSLEKANPVRADEWRRAREVKQAEWTLAELLEVRDQADLFARAEAKGAPDRDRLASLFYAQAWAFCRFLAFGADGKYRPKLTEYARRELRGESGPDVFREVLGADPVGLLAEGFEAHVRRLLEGDETPATPPPAAKDLGDIYARIPDEPLLDDLPCEEYERLRDLSENEDEPRLVPPERYAEVERLLQATLAHLLRLSEDPAYATAVEVGRRMKVDPILRDFEFDLDVELPSVLAVERAAGGAEAAAEVSRRTMDLLRTLCREFTDRIAKPAGITMPAGGRRGREWISVLVFRNEESFEKYQEMIGLPLPPGVRGYYSPVTRWVVLYEGEPRSGDPTFDVNKTLHECFHALMHACAKTAVEEALGEEVAWTDPRLKSRLHWFQEGLAELVASSRPKEGGGVELFAPNAPRAREWKFSRGNKWPEWSLSELLAITDGRDLQQKAARKGWADAQRLASLFYAEAWALCRFLWFFEDGKYRPKLLEYARRELRGESGPDVFREVFGCDPAEASGQEFETYVVGLMKTD